MPLEIVIVAFFTPDFVSFLGACFFAYLSTFFGLAFDAAFFSVTFFGDFFAGFASLLFLAMAGFVFAAGAFGAGFTSGPIRSAS